MEEQARQDDGHDDEVHDFAYDDDVVVVIDNDDVDDNNDVDDDNYGVFVVVVAIFHSWFWIFEKLWNRTV